MGGMGDLIVWVLQVGHGLGLGVGLSVGVGLRYRLLWFGSSGGVAGRAWLENGNSLTKRRVSAG